MNVMQHFSLEYQIFLSHNCNINLQEPVIKYRHKVTTGNPWIPQVTLVEAMPISGLMWKGGSS